jgi:hypothetical protein
MLNKLYTNSGLILLAILCAGVWTLNIQGFLADRKHNDAVEQCIHQPELSPTPKPTFEELLAQQQPAPAPVSVVDIYERQQQQRRYDDFDLVVNAPMSATGVCRDKTYSFGAIRRGACSRHGGVMSWLHRRR